MNLISPRATRLMFVAAVAMTVVSVTLSVFSAATVLSAPLASAVAVPNLVGFEGFLADANGAPLADGTYDITFRVYGVESGGSELWSEPHTAVQVTDGLYAVLLGQYEPFPTDLFSGSRWIGVTVGGSEMTPRTRVASVPFALNAESANTVRGGAGMIALFEDECPTGWTEYTTARGRVVVGVAEFSQSGLTTGTALSDGGTRTITDVPAHTHAPGTLTTSSAGDHIHGLYKNDSTGTDSYFNKVAYYELRNVNMNNYTYTTWGWGNDWGQVPLMSQAGAHTHTISGSSGSTGSTSVDVTMPYVQLVYCKLSP